jgi:hypothetical protein
MADLTEVCVWVNLGTAVRAVHFADGLSTLCTEHSLRVVDGSTEGAGLTCCLVLLRLLLYTLRREQLLGC